MSLPKNDTALDDLFRQSLTSIADREVPTGVWDRVVITVREPAVERTFLDALSAYLAPPQRGYSVFWRHLTSWAYSFVAYPPSSPQLTYWGSDGRCHASSSAGVVFPQILDLRHAS